MQNNFADAINCGRVVTLHLYVYSEEESEKKQRRKNTFPFTIFVWKIGSSLLLKSYIPKRKRYDIFHSHSRFESRWGFSICSSAFSMCCRAFAGTCCSHDCCCISVSAFLWFIGITNAIVLMHFRRFVTFTYPVVEFWILLKCHCRTQTHALTENASFDIHIDNKTT